MCARHNGICRHIRSVRGSRKRERAADCRAQDMELHDDSLQKTCNAKTDSPRQPVADGTSGAGSYACTVTDWTVVKITDVLRSVRPATFRCGAHRRGAADAWCYWPLRPSMRAMHRF
ncbi:hypothetical protein XFF6992_40008 [Xanthomonas citri pv. fuscans]|nr:hypothetical protein XFF6992_40008 [Xanthomonas citri pv. fuscans]SOO31915.1 hypothetical protein XFF6994_160008 [Xanthomonas citri pv. fuscans]